MSKTLRLHSIRHESFEKEGEIGVWAARHGHSLTHTDLWNGETLPPLNSPESDSFDWLIVMGGPMGVYDEDKYPWLAAEKAFLRAAVDAGKLILGVCLGAQLLSVVLGGTVTRNAHREIGWFPVAATPQAAESRVFRSLPQAYEAFHWHGDTFSIPPGALWTARSEACAHQAFESHAGRVVGLQFHLETNAASMAELSANCADELVVDRYVQPVSEMTARPERLTALRGLLDGVLDNMAALA